MAVNIVTGMTGDDHITSHDDRARHAAHFGRGKYVFPVGERFSAEKISENLVRIKDGMCINQGTQMGIEPNDYTDVEIDNGITGVNRHDLICMRYTKNADTGIENASLVVVKGTSGSEPTDPDVIEGNILDGGDLEDDMPLFRVVIEGITITSIVPVFEVFDGGNDKIEEIEQEIDSLSDDVTDLNNAMGGISRDVSALQGNVSTLQGNVSSLQSTVTNHTTSITGLEGDIDSLGGRMNTAESDINTLEHSLSTTKTATGNPILISDSAHTNAEELKVELEPIQDLHGYDKPWVGGAGKNIFGLEKNVVDKTSEYRELPQQRATISFIGENDFRAVGNGGTWTMGYLEITGIDGTLNYAISYRTVDNNTQWNPKLIKANEFSDSSKLVLAIVFNNTAALSSSEGVTFEDVQVEIGTETTTFEPYSNICPISGYDETSVMVSNKNLYNPSSEETFDATGEGDARNGHIFTQSGNYTVINNNSLVVINVRIVEKDRSTYGDYTTIQANSNNSFTVDSTHDLFVYHDTSFTDEQKSLICVRTDDSSDFISYQGNTYTLQFGDTVYGAEVDFVSGVATVTRGYIAEYAGETLPSTWISDRDVYVSGTTPTTGAQVAYKLASPQTIQLTPQQIKMLKGNNVLVADGDMDLTYQVDSVVGDVKEWAENEFLPKASETAQHNYSTQEQVVGTWIDGSTLYEKTIIYTNTPNSDSWTTIASLTGVSIKKCEGVYRRTNNRLNMFNNTYISTDQTEQLTIGISANNINVHIGSMFIPDFIQIEITIQYTKTTV